MLPGDEATAHLMFNTLVVFLYRQTNLVVACVSAWLFFSMCKLSGQTEVPLSLVEVKVEKLVISETGKKVQSMDSAMMQQYRMQSLGDLLSAGTSVFVKSYGPGAISSSTFRGGSAAHTAMMWHGINIQNAMLGQTDLSSLPLFLFNDVKVEYGGSSSLWGSGAVAGSIHLDNALSPGPNQTGIYISGGSFDLNRQGFSQAFNGNKCQSMTKLYRSHALNNYPYRNVSAFEGMKNLQQAREDLAGWMQDVKWQINNRQLLTVKAWVNSNRREVANYQNLPSQARQNDQAVRVVADWLYLKSKISSGIKMAYLRDGIQYTDSLARIDSKSTVHTFVSEEQT